MAHLPSWGLLSNPVIEKAPKLVDLVKTNTKLFRIYSDLSTSRLTPDGFVAGYYRDKDLPENLSSIPCEFSDAYYRITMWRNPRSKLVSTTCSFSYAVWEAFRRQTIHSEKGIHIAIIDAPLVAPHAITGVGALQSHRQQAIPETEINRAKYFTNAESEVFVKGQIPRAAIEATISISQLLPLLPSFYKQSSNGAVNIIFNYGDGSGGTRRADMLLQDAFLQSDPRNLENSEKRKGMGVDLAVGILESQDHYSSPATDEDYEDFVDRASLLAFELAHFPCDRFEAQELVSTLKLEDIDEAVRATLHQREIRSAMVQATQILQTRPESTRRQRSRPNEDLYDELIRIMSQLSVREST